MAAGLTEALGNFIASLPPDAVPAEAIVTVRRGIADCVGVADRRGGTAREVLGLRGDCHGSADAGGWWDAAMAPLDSQVRWP